MRKHIINLMNGLLGDVRNIHSLFKVLYGITNSNLDKCTTTPKKNLRDILPDTTKERVLYYALHLYNTCFLPMGKWFSDKISSPSFSNVKDISDQNVPLYILFPWPERSSMSWLKTPDIRKSHLNINFWNGTTFIADDAISAILQKILPFRSGGRSVGNKTKHASKDNESLEIFMYKLIQNTLLGMYENHFHPYTIKLNPALLSKMPSSVYFVES